jgi:hypothetical protein
VRPSAARLARVVASDRHIHLVAGIKQAMRELDAAGPALWPHLQAREKFSSMAGILPPVSP